MAAVSRRIEAWPPALDRQDVRCGKWWHGSSASSRDPDGSIIGGCSAALLFYTSRSRFRKAGMYSHGFPVLGSNQPIITCCGSRRLRGSWCFCTALAAKSAVCSLLRRLSCGRAIHSRMISLRITCLFICLSIVARTTFTEQPFDSCA
jgi:hypothetical protein